ncbi:MAG: hypothetical protein FWH57_11390 [Oscillospiraceae bacterium]|nr:hypothetical protein [Oscillospiraceae bacterium]
MKEKMRVSPSQKTLLIISAIIVIIVISAIGFYWSITDVGIDTSPTGEYSIKKYWTDIGAWGWNGKVYLVKHGFIDRKYWIGYYVPAASRWVSDYEFEITDGAGVSGTRIFSVYDFIT